MFDRAITSTPMTTTDANAYFETKIKDRDYAGDQTMRAVLRVLLESRLAEDEVFSMAIYGLPDGLTASTDYMSRYMRNCSNQDLDSSLTIYNINGAKERVEKCVNDLLVMFPGYYDGDWTELDRLRRYFRPHFPCVAFADTARKRTVFFVTNLTYSRFHMLAMSIPSLIPWYFTKERPFNNKERDLLKALAEDDSAPFLEALRGFADAYDFRGSFIRTQLAGLETRALRDKKSQLESTIRSKRDEIQKYDLWISNALEAIYNTEIELAGVSVKLAEGLQSGDSEIMTFFLNNPDVKLVSCNDSTIRFVCSGVLNDWDEDLAEAQINNEYSFLYGNTSELSKERIRRLLLAIFVDRALKLHVSGVYEFNFPSRVDAVSGTTLVNEFPLCYPNPHIQQYSCTGSFKVGINKFLQRHNYVSAIEACMASCCSFNWRDGTVMGTFADTFLKEGGWNRRAVELPTGEIVTPKQAVEWLEANDAEKEKEE